MHFTLTELFARKETITAKINATIIANRSPRIGPLVSRTPEGITNVAITLRNALSAERKVVGQPNTRRTRGTKPVRDGLTGII